MKTTAVNPGVASRCRPALAKGCRAFQPARRHHYTTWKPHALKDSMLYKVADPQSAQQIPGEPGVYAVLDNGGAVQYIGLSRKISVSVANHARDVPELVDGVKFEVVSSGSREALTAKWKEWIEEVVTETGNIPLGNAPGETKWQARAPRPKPEVRLTAGKPITGITIEGLIDQVVKTNKVVAFVKGTRTQPQCGFSHRMLTILNDMKADYEVVNVLDEFYNPGLREAIKVYSQWPTIPQLYIDGEFVGGADIVDQMVGTGELQELLRSPAPAK